LIGTVGPIETIWTTGAGGGAGGGIVSGSFGIGFLIVAASSWRHCSGFFSARGGVGTTRTSAISTHARTPAAASMACSRRRADTRASLAAASVLRACWTWPMAPDSKSRTSVKSTSPASSASPRRACSRTRRSAAAS
jgi:hypothetical protein